MGAIHGTGPIVRHGLLLVLLITPGLAGCVASPPPPAETARVPPIASFVSFAACEAQAGLFRLPPGAADAFLPTGFDAGGVGSLIVLAFDCSNVTSAEPTGIAARGAWWILRATPPPELRADDVDAHWAILGLVSDAPALDAVLASWGARPTASAVVGLERRSQGGAVWSAAFTADARGWSFAVDSAALGPPIDHAAEYNRAYVIEQLGGGPRVVAAFDFREAGVAVGPELVEPPFEVSVVTGRATLATRGEVPAMPVASAEGVAVVEWTQGHLATITRVDLRADEASDGGGDAGIIARSKRPPPHQRVEATR